jgi:hypothetical protein
LFVPEKNSRCLLLFVLFTLPYVGFSLSKLDIKNAFSCYMSS